MTRSGRLWIVTNNLYTLKLWCKLLKTKFSVLRADNQLKSCILFEEKIGVS